MDLTNIGFMKIRRQTTVLSIILIVISIFLLLSLIMFEYSKPSNFLYLLTPPKPAFRLSSLMGDASK